MLGAIPFLTRLVPPDEMGIYQAGFSIALIIQPLATLRRELLIPVSNILDSRKQRSSAIRFSLICSAILLALSIIAIYIEAPRLGETLAAAALVLASIAMLTIENAYLIRVGQLRRLAMRNLLAGALTAAIQVAVAAVLPSALGIAAAMLLGRFVATALTRAPRIQFQDERAGGERNQQRTASAILSATVASASTQAVIIGSFWTLGPGASAQIAIGQRIAGAPATLLGQALSQIALGAAAPLIRHRRSGLVSLLRTQVVKTSIGAAIASVALITCAPLLAEPVLGPGWQRAGDLTAIFAIPLSVQIVALPATTLMIPLGYERQLLGLQICRLVAILTALSASSALTGDLVITCVVTSATWTLAYVPIMAAAFTAARKHDRTCS